MSLLPLSVALLAAGDQPWKDKQIADWNDSDARQILTDSPWAKTVKPAVDRAAANTAQRRPAAGRGRGGGIGIGGIGISLPGMGGIGRRGGGGYPGGGYPGGSTYPGGTNGRGGYPGGQQPDGTNGGATAANNQPPELTLRWENALPIREAVLKARDTNAPTLDDGYYALAVYGVPSRMVTGDSRTLANKLKGMATIKRDGKKNLKPSSVVVLQRDSGPVFVYLFARPNPNKKTAIKPEDKRIEFDAQIGRLKFGESFFLEDMVYKGKLEI